MNIADKIRLVGKFLVICGIISGFVTFIATQSLPLGLSLAISSIILSILYSGFAEIIELLTTIKNKLLYDEPKN